MCGPDRGLKGVLFLIVMFSFKSAHASLCPSHPTPSRSLSLLSPPTHAIYWPYATTPGILPRTGYTPDLISSDMASSRGIAAPVSEVVVMALAVDVASVTVAVAVALWAVAKLVDLMYGVLLAARMAETMDVELDAEGTTDGRAAKAGGLLKL